jgi:hypothetical protein
MARNAQQGWLRQQGWAQRCAGVPLKARKGASEDGACTGIRAGMVKEFEPGNVGNVGGTWADV